MGFGQVREKKLTIKYFYLYFKNFYINIYLAETVPIIYSSKSSQLNLPPRIRYTNNNRAVYRHVVFDDV